jgi:hypothetical protein
MANPIAKHPLTLTSIVPTGKREPKRLVIAVPAA